MYLPYMLVGVVEKVLCIMEVLLRGRTASYSDLDLGLIIAIIMMQRLLSSFCTPKEGIDVEHLPRGSH